MSIVKLNNRSVKDITAFGSITSLGSLAHIATQTASSSASLSFTSGIDSTYKEYIFYFVNIHPASDKVYFTFQGSTDSGSNYNTTATTTNFSAYHFESDSATELAYRSTDDQAQSTNFINIAQRVGSDNDQSISGSLQLFNPSSTTFVKHFISRVAESHPSEYIQDNLVTGYFNTTNNIDAIQFKMSSGNIDAGTIKLYGIKGS